MLKFRAVLHSFLLLFTFSFLALVSLYIIFDVFYIEPRLSKISPELGEGSSKYFTKLSNFPLDFKKSLLKIEDPEFYEHQALDPKLIIQAFNLHFQKNKAVYGGSTITQQLARTLFLDTRRDLVRKIFEACISFRIESEFSKDRILELYINKITLGRGIFGFEAASKIYFGKNLSDLTKPEKARIMAIMPSPMNFNPENFQTNETLLARYKSVMGHLLGLRSSN